MRWVGGTCMWSWIRSGEERDRRFLPADSRAGLARGPKGRSSCHGSRSRAGPGRGLLAAGDQAVRSGRCTDVSVSGDQKIGGRTRWALLASVQGPGSARRRQGDPVARHDRSVHSNGATALRSNIFFGSPSAILRQSLLQISIPSGISGAPGRIPRREWSMSGRLVTGGSGGGDRGRARGKVACDGASQGGGALVGVRGIGLLAMVLGSTHPSRLHSVRGARANDLRSGRVDGQIRR